MKQKKLNKRNFEKTLNKYQKKSSELFKNERQVICCKGCGNILDKNYAVVIYDIASSQNEYWCKKCDEIYNKEQEGPIEPMEENENEN